MRNTANLVQLGLASERYLLDPSRPAHGEALRTALRPGTYSAVPILAASDELLDRFFASLGTTERADKARRHRSYLLLEDLSLVTRPESDLGTNAKRAAFPHICARFRPWILSQDEARAASHGADGVEQSVHQVAADLRRLAVADQPVAVATRLESVAITHGLVRALTVQRNRLSHPDRTRWSNCFRNAAHSLTTMRTALADRNAARLLVLDLHADSPVGPLRSVASRLSDPLAIIDFNRHLLDRLLAPNEAQETVQQTLALQQAHLEEWLACAMIYAQDCPGGDVCSVPPDVPAFRTALMLTRGISVTAAQSGVGIWALPVTLTQLAALLERRPTMVALALGVPDPDAPKWAADLLDVLEASRSHAFDRTAARIADFAVQPTLRRAAQEGEAFARQMKTEAFTPWTILSQFPRPKGLTLRQVGVSSLAVAAYRVGPHSRGSRSDGLSPRFN